MVSIKVDKIRERELNALENVLDSLIGKSEEYKEGMAFGPNLEEISRKVTGGRIFNYANNKNKAVLNANLLERDNYELILDLQLTPIVYDSFLRACQRRVPSVYKKLPKLESKSA